MYIIRAKNEIEIRLLAITLLKRDEKLMIFPRCILPLIRDTRSQIAASPAKNKLCEGRYVLKLAGLVHTISRKDIASMTISAKRVIV
jgi:hypothetical protein